MNRELIDDVRGWFYEKGIIAKSKPLKQLWKTQEEITETKDAMTRYEIADPDTEERLTWMYEIQDGIGDVCVTLIGVCEMLEIDFHKLHHEWSYEPRYQMGNESSPSSIENLQTNLGETRAWIIMQDWSRVADAIGAMIYDLSELCNNYELELEDCLEQAYAVISRRTGRMVDGVFVKDKEVEQ